LKERLFFSHTELFLLYIINVKACSDHYTNDFSLGPVIAAYSTMWVCKLKKKSLIVVYKLLKLAALENEKEISSNGREN